MTASTLAAQIVHVFTALSEGPNVPIVTAWSELFGVEQDSGQFYSCIGAIRDDLARLAMDVEKSNIAPRSKQLCTEAINSINNFTSVSGLASLTRHNLIAQASHFDRLQLISDVMPPLDSRGVDADVLQTARNLVKDLDDDLSGLDIDARLKAFLHSQTSELLWAIDNFQYVGINGLARTWGATVTEITRATGMKGAETNTAKSWLARARHVGKEIGNSIIFVGAVAGAISTATITADAALHTVLHEHSVAAPTEPPASNLRQV